MSARAGISILTLCFQTTLYADGFAFTLHSKYTSSPSSMSSGFMLVPMSVARFYCEKYVLMYTIL
uniref:Secreted protein n=1 Tax=Anopheles atroparvus TaxID=41427 RepID=A0AAG5D3C1_ANOAO